MRSPSVVARMLPEPSDAHNFDRLAFCAAPPVRMSTRMAAAPETRDKPETPPRPGRAGRARSVVRRVLIALAGVLLLLPLLAACALVFVTHTGAGRRFAADRLERGLGRAIPGAVRIGELERLDP